MRRRSWAGLAIVGVVGVVILGVLVMSGRAPALSGVGTTQRPCAAGASACLTFPVMSGQDLVGDPFQLPADFQGKANLVLVPFDEDQTVKAQSWLPFARQLAATDPNFRSYNVPIFPSMAAPMRALIRAGMSVTIGDEALRAVTITVFLDDRDAFLKTLGIPNTNAMQVFLLDNEGRVLWRGAGVFSDEQGAAVRALVSG